MGWNPGITSPGFQQRQPKYHNLFGTISFSENQMGISSVENLFLDFLFFLYSQGYRSVFYL